MSKKEGKGKKGFTRRSFLKRTGVVGAGIAASGPLSNLMTGPNRAEAGGLDKGGYAGKILHVDLGGGHGGGSGFQTWTEPTKKYSKKFLGARGIHEWIIFNEVPSNADPYDPGNILCIGGGPLVGTLMPVAARTEISTINSMCGAASHSSSGSAFAGELKYAGYDSVVISGKAEEWSYLWIEDDRVELRDAGHLVGLNPIDAIRAIREELGDKWIYGLGIGVAGENLVRFACVQGDHWHTHGGLGCGAVMGSKNIKAVAVRGHGAIKVAHPEEFKKHIDDLWDKQDTHPSMNFGKRDTHWWERSLGGNNIPVQNSFFYPLPRNRNGQWLGKNFSDEDTEKMGQKPLDDKGITGRRYSCVFCPGGCGTYYKIKKGRHAGVKGKWIMFCLPTTFCSNFDPVPKAEDVVTWVYLGDSLGMDDGIVSGTISWAIECYQRGLITKKDTGIKLKWPRETGSNELLFKCIEMIARREGKLGELLADGAFEAVKKLEGRTDAEREALEYYIIGTKKGAVVSHDHVRRKVPLDVKWNFANVLSIRGGKHADGAFYGAPGDIPPPSENPDCRNGTIYKDAGRRISHQEWNKGVYDTTGLCWIARIFLHDEIATALNLLTDSSYTSDSLIQMGRKVLNVSKAINTLRNGWTRDQDTPLPRVCEPLPPDNDPSHLEMGPWNEQLDLYYDFHGWDPETGWQKRKTLKELGLSAVAWELWYEDKLK